MSSGLSLAVSLQLEMPTPVVALVAFADLKERPLEACWVGHSRAGYSQA